MAATINGKPVLSHGTYLLRAGETLLVPGTPGVEIVSAPSAASGIAASVSATGYFQLSINGLASNLDAAGEGTGNWGPTSVKWVAYAFKAATFSAGPDLYRIDFAFVES